MMQKHIYKPKKGESYSFFASKFIADEISRLNKSEINIALSGGSTPLPILNALKEENILWENINFFIVDERCVDVNDNDSNFKNLKSVFFNHISSNSFPIVINNGKSYEDLAFDYSELIERKLPVLDNGFPQFDIVVLGMGEDGHTASLFPETKGLKENSKSVVLNYVPKLESYRISLTYPVLLNSKEIIVLIKGEAKKIILDEIYSTNVDTYPICKIAKEFSNLKWLIP